MTKELAEQYGYKTVPAGVVITDVSPGSSADNEGLKEGMVILQVGETNIETSQQFEDALAAKKAAEGARLRVTTPSGGTLFVFLTPKK